MKTYAAEYAAGQWKAGRVHIGKSTREIIRECLRAIAPQHRRAADKRKARHAYYRGALDAIAAERELCRQFRL